MVDGIQGEQASPKDENQKTSVFESKGKYTDEEIKQQLSDFKLLKEGHALHEEKINLLYVDDEEFALTSFKSTFRRSYAVHIAKSAEEGRAILREREIDVVMTDQRMPGETGVEFLKSILPEYEHVVRIMLTGYSDMDVVIDAVNDGRISHYATKPFKEERMIKLLKRASEVILLRRERDQLLQMALTANEQLQFVLRDKSLDLDL